MINSESAHMDFKGSAIDSNQKNSPVISMYQMQHYVREKWKCFLSMVFIDIPLFFVLKIQSLN